jgi:hypothetical protein
MSFIDTLDDYPGELRVTSSTGGQKGTKITRMASIPGDVLLEFSKIYGLGAIKYDDHNWRKGYSWHLSIDSALRHLEQFNAGEDFNEEDFPGEDVKHVLQAAWHCFTLAWYMDHRRQFDDRPETEEKKPF